jgi:hypothetical protein
MKRFYVPGLILSVLILFVPMQAVKAAEAEPDDEFIWSEQGPPGAKEGFKWFKLTDEAIERLMKTVEEKDPAKAKQLEQLRNNDPNAFQTEIRKVMREHFGRTERIQQQRRMGPAFGTEPPMLMGEPHRGLTPPGPELPDVDQQQMQQKYLHWLEENQPERADELKKLQNDNPDLFEQRMQRGMRWHRRLMDAEKENPELAEALKKSMELRDAEKGLLEKIAAAKTKKQKQETIKQLEDTVRKRFDLIVKRKQIIYEMQKQKIKVMQDQLEKIEKEIEKWQQPAFKAETVKKKMEKLISRAEEFKWD